MDHHSQSKQYDIFISHSSGDQAFAGRLARELQSQGYKIWLDDWEILVGHNIVDEIYKGIANSKFVVVLLSKDACESEWAKGGVYFGANDGNRRTSDCYPAGQN